MGESLYFPHNHISCKHIFVEYFM